MSIPVYLPEYTDELGERKRSLAPLEMTANEQIRYLEEVRRSTKLNPHRTNPMGQRLERGMGC